MYLLDNPVLQRELLVNLRMVRAFVLLFLYLALLGPVVYFAWPHDQKIDTRNPQAAIRLVNLFFLGQYMLASLMAPSFAAGDHHGREGAQDLRDAAGQPAAARGRSCWASCWPRSRTWRYLIFSSLPIVMLCLPLGGVSFYEVLAVYFALILSVVTFGMISVACSSYFQRTAAVAGRVVPAHPAAGPARACSSGKGFPIGASPRCGCWPR